MEDISYRPQNVRETLVELKNTSELAVDLAYAAVLYEFPGLAEEVLALEARADTLQYPAKISLMLAAKRSTDAEELVGIIQIVEAAVMLTNAAADIAAIALNGVGLPGEVRESLPEADEVVMRATVSEESAVVGQTLGELTLAIESGVVVSAIRRGSDWNIAPDSGTVLKSNDIVIGSGSETGVTEVKSMITGEAAALPTQKPGTVEQLERAGDLIIDLKNISELSVGLSYAAVLFDDETLAQEVLELEVESDRLQDELELLVIEASPSVANPGNLRGLLRIATASETICDAAVQIADIVLRDGHVHPVFAQAIGESEELIMTTRITENSMLAEATLESLELEEQTGMSIMAIHRNDDWLLAPSGESVLRAGDLLIVRGPREGGHLLTERAGINID